MIYARKEFQLWDKNKLAQCLYTTEAKSDGSPMHGPTVTGMTASWRIYELSQTQKSGKLVQGNDWISRILPTLSCIRNNRQNTYLSDPHLQLWCYSSLWNPARQNRALPGISSWENEQIVWFLCEERWGKAQKHWQGWKGEDDTRKIWM